MIFAMPLKFVHNLLNIYMLQSSHFVLSLQNTKSVYGIHYYNSTKLLGFTTMKQAEKCKKAIVYYKHKYGNWPLYIKDSISEHSNKNMSLQTIYNSVDINYANTESMIEFCTLQNLGIIFCNSFELENSEFRIQGKQIEPPNNYELFLQGLEYTYNNS
jgi:hypothetical protein